MMDGGRWTDGGQTADSGRTADSGTSYCFALLSSGIGNVGGRTVDRTDGWPVWRTWTVGWPDKTVGRSDRCAGGR